MKKYLILLLLVITLKVEAQDNKVWTLKECIDYALENNLLIKQNELDVQLNDLEYDQARLGMLPDLNGNGSYSFSWGRSIDPTTNLFVDNRRIASANAGLSSNVLLFNGLRQQNNVKQNRFALQSSKENLKATSNDVTLNVVTFYMNVLFAQSLVEIAKNQLEATTGQMQATEKQVNAGALPQSNLLDLKSQRATNELNLVNRENDLILAKIQLKQVLQLPPTAQIEIVDPEIEVESADIIEETAMEVYNYAVANMPEIKAAQYSLEGSDYGIKAAQGGLYPSISLSGGINSRYSDASQIGTNPVPFTITDPRDGEGTIQIYDQIIFDDGNGISTLNIPATRNSDFETIGFSDQVNNNLSKYISLSLNIPIFNGFQARANVQRAQIARDRAEINLKNEKYALWQTVEQSYADVLAALKSYVASTAQVEATEESFRMTQKRYNFGASTFIDYQIAENQLFQARADLLQAKYDFIYKSKILDFYLGKPIEL